MSNSVSTMRACGGALVGGGRFFPDHHRNQTHAHFSAQSNSGAAMIRCDFTAMACRKVKMSLKLAAILANVSVYSAALFSIFFLCIFLLLRLRTLLLPLTCPPPILSLSWR